MSTELPTGRRDEIADRLASGQQVVASSLAVEFGVSEDAIRRDLRALAAEGRCRRVYGGALPITTGSVPLAARIGERSEGKLALAVAGASIIQPGELLFLDSGSTNLAIVETLPEDIDLTVATNSPDIAAALLRRADLPVILIGGMVDPVVGGCVDAVAAQSVAQMRFDRAFIGTCAVSSAGVAAFHHGDAHFKRMVIARATQTVVLATTEKLDARAPHSVAALDQIDLLVVEESATPSQRAALDSGDRPRLMIATPA